MTLRRNRSALEALAFPEDGDDAESLLRKADAAMYREKVGR